LALRPVQGGLTANDVAARAVVQSGTVESRRSEVVAARARVRQTFAQFLPRLTLSATYTRLSPVSSGLGGGALAGAANPGPLLTGPCPPGMGLPDGTECVVDITGQPAGAAEFAIEALDDNYALGAQLGIPLSDYLLTLGSATQTVKHGQRAAELGVEAEKLRVENDARQLYYGWLRAKAGVAIAESSLERIRARLKDAEAAFTLGVITRADLMRLQALEASMELMLKEADTMRATAEHQLATVMNQPLGTAYEVGEDLDAPVTNTVDGELVELVRRAQSSRLDVQALEQASEALRHGTSASRAAAYPRLDAFADVTYANPNQRYFPPARQWDLTWAVGLRASWMVTDVLIQGAAADQLAAQRSGIEGNLRALRDGVRAMVTSAYLNRERANFALETSRRGLAAAEEAYRVATDLYQVGRATTTELIEAESDLLRARLAEVDARIGLRIAEHQLRHAIGADVPVKYRSRG
jgi:outer membrane protein TolC